MPQDDDIDVDSAIVDADAELEPGQQAHRDLAVDGDVDVDDGVGGDGGGAHSGPPARIRLAQLHTERLVELFRVDEAVRVGRAAQVLAGFQAGDRGVGGAVFVDAEVQVASA